MLHKEIPFLRIGLPLCFGIISGLYFNPGIIFLVSSVIIITIGFISGHYYNKYRDNPVFGFSLTIALFTCGLLLYTNEKAGIPILKPEQSLFDCTLSDFPEEKENSYMLTVRLNSKSVVNGDGTIKGSKLPIAPHIGVSGETMFETIKGSMILYNKKDPSMVSLLPGDRMIIKCTPVEITNRGNPCEFDYRFYMENHGIRYYAFTNSGDILKHHPPRYRKLVHRALIIREKIIGMYKERGITGDRLALVAAMTLGQKSMLDPEQKQNFIKAGVMHIMAVSGLHAVILSLFVFNLLFFLKRRFNTLRILITILILWSFAFVTGLTPSVLRATLMFSFLQAGNLMKREVNGINSVLASAFVLILIRPSVIFDAGFLLSYSAVIYIISFYKDLYHLILFKNRLKDKIWQSVVVTIVAQAGTLPLTIMFFNRFPTYFIIANIIIVPLSSLVIIIGCLVPMAFPIHFLSRFLATILNYLTGLTELLTARTSALPYSTIENIGMTTVECVLLTFTLFLFSTYLFKKQPFSIVYPLSALLLFTISGTTLDITSGTRNELIVYNTQGSATIGIKTGKILNIYTDTLSVVPEVNRHCATLGLKLNTFTIRNNVCCIKAGEKNILITKSLDKQMLKKFIPDFVILTGPKPEIEKSIAFVKLPEAIIISSQAASGYRVPFQLNLAGTSSVYHVRKSGAYTKRI
ncbi:MAG: ComEC family competence protein [Bacteroidales bacterium]|nr:ComEC family competence protein [Bacteroidales bacterium]